jgi:hypothetical protein
MFQRAFLVWIGLMFLAIGNGFLRESALVPAMGVGRAHVLSTILLCLLILVLTWLAIPWIAPESNRTALLVGGFWLGLTLAFEFGFGRAVARKSWDELLTDYDLSRGRIWPLVLVATLTAPWLTALMRGLI